MLKGALLFVAALMFAACSFQEDAESDELQLANNFLEQLLAGNEAALRGQTHPNLYQQMVPQLPIIERWLGETPRNFEFISVTQRGAMTTPLGLVKTATLVFRAPAEGASMNAQQPYGPEARWLYAEITIVRSQDGLSVISWTVVPTSVDLAESSAFSFESAGPAHYFWVLMMVAMPVICIVAIFLIWRGPAFPMRWLWTIGSLIGFTSFNLNWSSGEIGFQPIYISLLAAGLFKFGLFSPWQMRFGIPIVALLFLCWKRRQLCVVDDRAATEWISQ